MCDSFLQYDARKFDFSRVFKPTFRGYLGSCENIFCFRLPVNAICVYWQELDGILKENGRSVEGNWTTLDENWIVYWRKLDGLMTETGRSLEGNRTVYWRKLDGLDTETGWSIDGNWMVNWRKLDGKREVYWWKQSSRFSLFWGPENAILPSSETRGIHFGEQKIRFLPSRETKGYQIFRILATWKCDFCRFVKPTFQGTSQRVEIFLIFEARKCVLPCLEIHVARIPSFVLSNFPHFSGLKMRFLPIRGTIALRYLVKRGNFHFSCKKCAFAQ